MIREHEHQPGHSCNSFCPDKNVLLNSAGYSYSYFSQTQTCLVLMKQFIILLCGSIKDCDPRMCEKLIILIEITQKVKLVFKN